MVEKELGTKFNMDHTIVLEASWPLLQAIEKAQSLDTDKGVDTWEKIPSIESIYDKQTLINKVQGKRNRFYCEDSLYKSIQVLNHLAGEIR